MLVAEWSIIAADMANSSSVCAQNLPPLNNIRL